MIWAWVGLAIAAGVTVVMCICGVSGQQDAAAAELERALREQRSEHDA